VNGAWELLCRDHRPLAEAMTECVVSLAPLPSSDDGDGSRGAPAGEALRMVDSSRSASTGEAFGMIMCSEPRHAAYMAEALVHDSRLR
jgi:HEXXH motif-containing protein